MNESNLDRGQRLQKLRTERGITLRELEQAVGYDDGYLCMLENGKRRWNDNLERIYSEGIARIVKQRKDHLIQKLSTTLSQLLSAA